jgi:hypothetical protein
MTGWSNEKPHEWLGHPHPKKEFCYWCNPDGYPGMGGDAILNESQTRQRLKEMRAQAKDNEEG